MLKYDNVSYSSMYGNIEENLLSSAARCVSQCSGCMCSCRCTCSGGNITVSDWEDL